MANESSDGSTSARSAKDHFTAARVLVVDDQVVFRDVMRAVVEATPGLELVAEASCGKDALATTDELAPDLVIVDIRMPGMDGLTVARTLLERTPAPVVLLVSAQPPPASLPIAPDGSMVAFVAKEHLRPAVLRELWGDRGWSVSATASKPDPVA
jgi:CheY-like chemotaxis protein